MNTRSKILSAAAATAVMTGLSVAYAKKRKEGSHAPLEVDQSIDLDQYLGEWYEIARMPALFERSCYGTKAKYSKNEDGSIQVENSCHKNSLDGPLKTTTGKAFVSDKETHAKLKVQFFWPFTGDYWILDVGDQYEYALVGEPTRKHMWILSRTPEIELEALQDLTNKAKEKGFDTEKLIFTEQMAK